MSLYDALRFASAAAAALSVTKAGAQSSVPTLREVEMFLRANLVEFERSRIKGDTSSCPCHLLTFIRVSDS